MSGEKAGRLWHAEDGSQRVVSDEEYRRLRRPARILLLFQSQPGQC